MPAQTIDELYDIEPAIEMAVKLALAEHGIKGATQAETENLPVPRVDIQATIGEQLNHFSPRQKDGAIWPTAFNFSLILEIVAARPAENAPKGTMTLGLLRARVRTLMAQLSMRSMRGALPENFADPFNAVLMPFHEIASIRHDSAAPAVEGEQTDTCALRYSGLVTIRASAFPA